ncbi:metal ABC transporter solute-binding protein, Zn/Mn family [Latilactobacillus graminis]|nr:zinc ABC transporter substrate-binding protein [Latilactobacillus graminis]QFP80245.1 metal ABC transporter substrate-binding protein [Latilactobacillus graminis]
MKKMVITLMGVLCLVGGVYGLLDYRAQVRQFQTRRQHKLRVVTTNSILEDMVHNVGQEHIELYSIVKRGTDPHEYEPQPTDIAQATDADVIFHNGLNLETGGNGWFSKLMKIAHKQFEKDVFAASKGIEVQHLTTNKNEPDPHAWLSLANGIQYVENITTVLQAKDPAHADAYRKNANRYRAQLRQLHRQTQVKFAGIPTKQRVLVTSEGAFKYFGQAYQVTPTYIWEINTESQGTPEQMQAVLNKIATADVRNLFIESSVSPKSMGKVAQETGLPIYAKIFTDSLATSGQTGDTYYTMMRWNINQIYAGLVG